MQRFGLSNVGLKIFDTIENNVSNFSKVQIVLNWYRKELSEFSEFSVFQILYLFQKKLIYYYAVIIRTVLIDFLNF